MRLVQALRRWRQPSSVTATIVGIVLVGTGGGGTGSWQRVDKDGNALTTSPAFFNAHPTYAGIVGETIDSQFMVKIPAFYVKAGVVASGVYAGKRVWWVSDLPSEGFILHPAFMSQGTQINNFWIGKYQASTSDSKLGSVPGVLPAAGLSLDVAKSLAAARNVAGLSGFRAWDYLQLSAMQILIVIEVGGADSKTLVGPSNLENQPQVVDSAAMLTSTWRGIVGLWGNQWAHVDGIRSNSSNLFEVWDSSGNQSFVTTSQAAYSGSGRYPNAFSSASGSSYDLSIGFFASGTTSNSTLGVTGDCSQNGAASSGYRVGGRDSVPQGLFHMYGYAISSSYAGQDTGSRLSKI